MRTAVVILNWNGAKLLRHYLPLVLARTSDADIIVADNASTDDSLATLRDEFPGVQVIQFSENYGFAGGYNRALAAIDHDYVVLLNSDVAPSDGWLEPLVEMLDSNGDVAVCGSKLRDDKDHRFFEYAGAAGGFLDMFGYPFCRGRVLDTLEEDGGQYDTECDCLWVSGAALCVRRRLFVEVGGLDETFFAHMEEIDLCWRLRNMGHRVVAVPRSMVYHLGGATLDSLNPRKTYLNFRNNLMMIVKNYNSCLWWMVLFMRLILDGVAGLKFVVARQPQFCWAIVRAHRAFFREFPDTLTKRRELKRGRGRKLVPEVKRYSMLVRYYLMRRRTYGAISK